MKHLTHYTIRMRYYLWYCLPDFKAILFTDLHSWLLIHSLPGNCLKIIETLGFIHISSIFRWVISWYACDKMKLVHFRTSKFWNYIDILFIIITYLYHGRVLLAYERCRSPATNTYTPLYALTWATGVGGVLSCGMVSGDICHAHHTTLFKRLYDYFRCELHLHNVLIQHIHYKVSRAL